MVQIDDGDFVDSAAGKVEVAVWSGDHVADDSASGGDVFLAESF